MDPLKLISDWVDRGASDCVALGLSVSEARSRASELLQKLNHGSGASPGSDDSDVLFAALRLLHEDAAADPTRALTSSSRFWKSLTEEAWKTDELDERKELICSFSFMCWRAASLLGDPAERYKWEFEYRSTFRESLQWEVMCSRFLLDSHDLPPTPGTDLNGESVFQTLMFLQDNCDAAPETVGSHAVDLYRALDSARAALPHDLTAFLAGNAARIAGAAMMRCGGPDEASEWLDIAEAELGGAACARADLARVSYQRLALLYRLSRFDLIEQAIPAIDKTFVDLGMLEDYIKCRILWASSLKIVGKCDAALRILEPLQERRAQIPSALYGWILLELGDLHQIGGRYEDGIAELAEAADLLKDNNHFTGLADATSMLAAAYRAQGMLREASELFQQCRKAYGQLGMKSLEAYIRILLAETFLAMEELADAEREVLETLPTLLEHRMLAEATAGLNLLREVARRKKPGQYPMREDRLGPRR